MKRTKIYFGIMMLSLLVLTSCDRFKEADEAEKIQPLNVLVNLSIDVPNLATAEGLVVNIVNNSEGYTYRKEFSGTEVSVEGVIPGVYTISVSGAALDTAGDEYFINGNSVNKALYAGVDNVTIVMQGLKVSPLVMKEIYYCGSLPPVGFSYFRDQFYEIYNNSSEVQYLDGVYFGHLYPTNATRTLPVWPESDGNKYCYGERIWKFPGNGTQYPLQPGESAVVAQFAANHKLEIYNPNSPVDCSHAEFEFNMNNANFPDQPAIDMIHVYYDGKAEMGTVPQYLTPVFGSAYVMFRVPAGETWDPVNNLSLQADNLATTSIERKCKIPITYVLDAVEAVNNDTYADAKRIPAVLDAGVTTVGATYCGQGIVRKVSLTESGDTIRRENGALIFQDTNNSTDDFERNVIPVLHRYGTGVPSWNVTY
ncbi:MAG: DUF4876 domain-containing protein [Prevotella sp.]|nr:DUF4876 domain-containing protein [Prevotella sp.]